MRHGSHFFADMMKVMQVRGINIDEHGRCLHYRSERDIVANRCATCRQYWACHACHSELADHPFGRMPLDDPEAVLCGACGHTMDCPTYSRATACPSCRRPFNPGCAAHAPRYFEV